MLQAKVEAPGTSLRVAKAVRSRVEHDAHRGVQLRGLHQVVVVDAQVVQDMLDAAQRVLGAPAVEADDVGVVHVGLGQRMAGRQQGRGAPLVHQAASVFTSQAQEALALGLL
eukprot:5005532-Pyramimonas_sp.AAC.1